MSASAKKLPITAADLTKAYYHPEIFIVRRSDRWKRHHYTMLDSLIHLESIGLTIPVSAFYQTASIPDDVERPWYLRYREDG